MNTRDGLDAYKKALYLAVDDAFDVAFAMSTKDTARVLREMVNEIVDEVIAERRYLSRAPLVDPAPGTWHTRPGGAPSAREWVKGAIRDAEDKGK